MACRGCRSDRRYPAAHNAATWSRCGAATVAAARRCAELAPLSSLLAPPDTRALTATILDRLREHDLLPPTRLGTAP